MTWDKTSSRVLIFYARPITLWVFRWNYVAQGLDFANSKAKVRVQHEILWLRWVTDLFKFQKTYDLCLDLLRAFDNIKLHNTGAISNKNQLCIEPIVTTEIYTVLKYALCLLTSSFPPRHHSLLILHFICCHSTPLLFFLIVSIVTSDLSSLLCK